MTIRHGWLVAAGVVVAAFIGWMFWYDPDRPFHEMVERMRAAGEPLTYDDIAPPPLAPEENGAADLLAALEWLDANMPPAEEWAAPGPWNPNVGAEWQEAPTPEQREAVAALTARIRPATELLARAASKPRIQFVAGPADAAGFHGFDHVAALQRAAKVLCCPASGATDPRERLEAIASLAAIGDRLTSPSIIETMVALAIAGSVAPRQIRFALREAALDPVAARRRLDPLLRLDGIARLRATLRFERVLHVEVYRRVVDGTSTLQRAPWYERAICRASGGRFFRSADDRLDASSVVRSYESLLAAEAVPLSTYSTYEPRVLECFDSEERLHSVYLRMIATAAERMAAQRLARIALAAAEHRTTHGSLPASMSDLDPLFPDGSPLDPFTDAPFLFERTAEGVRIASRGSAPDRPGMGEGDLRERTLLWDLPR